MSLYQIYKLEVANRLVFGPTIKDAELRGLLEKFIEVCKEGLKLEAENADLRREIAALKREMLGDMERC